MADPIDLSKVEPRLFSVNDTARILGIGRTKLYNLLAKGELASVQIGRRRLVTYHSILGFIIRAGGGEVA